MDMSTFEGRWREPEAQGALRGDLVWLKPGKGGLQTHVATVAGQQVATLRKHLYERGYSVRIAGWLWMNPAVESVAAGIGAGEVEVKGFADLRKAKKAVKYALDRLPTLVRT